VGGHYSLLALECLNQERKRRETLAEEWLSQEFLLGLSFVGSLLVCSFGWRICRRRRLAKSGYQELLGTARSMRRRFSSRGGVGGSGEESIWLAETPEQGSVFDLGMSDGGDGRDGDDDDDDEEEWSKRRIRRRSSSLT
jgi:hypothetical protein